MNRKFKVIRLRRARFTRRNRKKFILLDTSELSPLDDTEKILLNRKTAKLGFLDATADSVMKTPKVNWIHVYNCTSNLEPK
jgi:hypothetical protein